MGQALLYGIHDPGGEHLLPTGSTIVFTEGIGCNPDDMSGGDYRRWEQQGYQVIVRLNNGYGADGTIPTPDKYADFARRCANYIRNSPGCTHWIIGNEPNHAQERPQGQPISAQEYVGCFMQVATAVYEGVGAQHQLIAAAVAPWNVETGDWLYYMERMLAGLQGYADGIALHIYTHGSDPALVTSEATMDAPFDKRRFHFRAYIDMMDAIPDAMRDLPVYITETDQDVPWLDANNGWVQAAYAEIDRWNQQAGNQRIHCLCLYRWPNYDQWGFVDKLGVHDDLRAAVAKNYTVPQSLVAPVSTPPTAQPVSPVPVQVALPVQWDSRLTQRGVLLTHTTAVPGWRVVRAEYRDVAQSQGRHHIYVDVLDENGVRVVGAPVYVLWRDGRHELTTEAKPGEESAANFPMYAAGSAYTLSLGVNSDAVSGMGLGDIATPNQGDHVSYYLVFQRTVEAATSAPEEPETPTTVYVPIVETTPVTVTPVTVTPEQSEANWQRAYPFVLNMEGGLSTDRNDKGNYTPSGEFKGTKFGISARSYPHLDIANLTREQALDIYRRDYWEPSGAAAAPWPLCLALFDTAINHGVGAAKRIHARQLSEIELYQAKRMLDYITYETWPHHGVAWGNRVRHLLQEAKKA
jgi:hypothetical protein